MVSLSSSSIISADPHFDPGITYTVSVGGVEKVPSGRDVGVEQLE
jgi:hypothetical protein